MGERETLPKRPREEAEGEEAAAEAKRHQHHHQQSQQQRPASYHYLLSSLLDEEGGVVGGGGGEGEEGEISSLMTALQQELSTFSEAQSPPPAAQPEAGEDEAGCDAEGVMRRLLEASDDDLGIPPSGDADGERPPTVAEEAAAYGAVAEERVGGLWVEGLEMDAMAAGYFSFDYYALLQPELFL